MKTEYSASAMYRTIFLSNGLMGFVGVILFIYFSSEGGVSFFFPILLMLWGALFWVMTYVRFRWPVLILDEDTLHYRTAFGKLKKIAGLGAYEAKYANGDLLLYGENNSRQFLNSSLISKKQNAELMLEINRLCKNVKLMKT